MSMWTVFILLVIIASVFLAAEIWRETHSFSVTRYQVKSEKLKGLNRDVKIVFLSDLHNCVYGKTKICLVLFAVRIRTSSLSAAICSLENPEFLTMQRLILCVSFL